MSDSTRPRKHHPGMNDYAVGYGKPPAESRFKPGKSGNPAGRPRGARNKKPTFGEERLKDLILEEAYRPIKVNHGDRPLTMPVARAVMRSLALNAAKGQAKAQKLFVELLSETESSNNVIVREMSKELLDYKHKWAAELARRRNLGIAGDDPIPHPDDIVVDRRSGIISIDGPITKEEKEARDFLWQEVRDIDELVREVEAKLRRARSPGRREALESILRKARAARIDIVQAVGEPTNQLQLYPSPLGGSQNRD